MNNDGALNKDDARFAELKVWVDANGNGVTDAGELKTLAEHGITEIGLRGQNREGTADVGDNVLLSTATFKRENGSTGTLGNVALAYKPGKGSTGNGAGIGRGDGDGILNRPPIPGEISINEPVDLTLLSEVAGGVIGGDVPTGDATSTSQSAEALVAALRSSVSPGLGSLNSLSFDSNIPANVDPFDYFSDTELDLAAFAIGRAESVEADSIAGEAVMREGVESKELDTAAAQPATTALNSDKTLALITQDMAAFGPRTGEDDLAWRKDDVRPTHDWFA
jgi:hypothetical protein